MDGGCELKIPKYARKLRKKSMTERRRGIYRYAPEGVPQKPLNRQYRKFERRMQGRHLRWWETRGPIEWIKTSDPRLRVDAGGNVYLLMPGKVEHIHTHISVSLK